MKTNSSLFFTLIVFLLVFIISTNSPVDNDMWWHLRAGDEMFHQGGILLTDEFSYTRLGQTWVNAFWISDLGLYGLWSLGGFFVITLAVSLLAVSTMAVIFLQMDGSPYLRGLLVVLAMMGAIANWTPRPQLVSFLILAILDFFLYRHIRFKRQPLWVLPLIFALWGNLHGGFIWGALLLIAVLAGEAFNIFFNNHPALNWRELASLALWSILALLAVLINPNGTLIWQLPFHQVDVSLVIQEWRSPDFHQFYAHPILWMFFLLIFGLAFGSNPMSFVDLFKGLGFAYLFFFAQRNLVAFAIVITPIVARHLSSALKNLSAAPNLQKIFPRFLSNKKELSPRLTRVINLFFIGLFAAFAFSYAYFVSLPLNIARKVPEESTVWIQKNRPTGKIFNSYNWGGYLTWRLREYPVFIDGRADLYGNKMIQDWMDISNGTKRGLGLLDFYEINLIYLEPYHALLEKLPPQEWQKVYADTQIVIYQRKP